MNVPEQMKTNLDKAIEAALTDRSQFPASAFTRNSPLSAEAMVKLMLSMRAGTLNSELYDAGVDVTKSAFSKRRKLLPSSMFEQIFEDYNALCKDTRLYKGYQVYAIDGTVLDAPLNTSSRAYFTTKQNPKGLNQYHHTVLYNVLDKTFGPGVLQYQKDADEHGALEFILLWYDLPKNTLIVGDRGFESYRTFADFKETSNADFLIRVRTGINGMKPIRELLLASTEAEFDKTISFTITTSQSKEHLQEKGYVLVQNRRNTRPGAYRQNQDRWTYPSPYPMTLRVLKIRLSTGEDEVLVTSLPNSFTLDEIRELYHARWGIENSFREWKYCLGTSFHGKSDEAVRQEIWASMTMANLCNRIMGAVEIPASRRAKWERQINATMGIKLCREFYRTPGADGEKLMRQIARYTEPIRPGRQDERNLKAKSFVGFVYRPAAA